MLLSSTGKKYWVWSGVFPECSYSSNLTRTDYPLVHAMNNYFREIISDDHQSVKTPSTNFLTSILIRGIHVILERTPVITDRIGECTQSYVI